MGKKTSTGLPAQPNNSLITGMDCLYTIINADKPIGSVELAQNLGKGHSTVNRLLGTLQFMGLLAQDHQRKYIPGPAIHVLAAQSLHASSLLSITLRIIQSIPKNMIHNQVIALGVLHKENVLYLLHKGPGEEPIDSVHPMHLYHYQDSIIGKLLYNYTENNYNDYFYQELLDEHKICFPIGHVKKDMSHNILQQIQKPIAGLAFVDRSCEYSENTMSDKFRPYAIEICEQLSKK